MLEMALGALKVFTAELVREAEEGLVLFDFLICFLSSSLLGVVLFYMLAGEASGHLLAINGFLH